MSDDPVRTRLRTDEGWLDFQEYFVHRRCEPVVHELLFQGAGAARAHPDFLAALADPSLQAIVICPSNPFISVEPILAIPGVRQAMIDSPAPIIAVSPIIAGQAVKGPTAKMMKELGLDPSAGTVAHRYHDLLDGYVIDHADMSEVVSIDARVTLAQTLMRTMEDREALARTVLDAAAVLRAARKCVPEIGAMIDVWACVPVKEFTGAKQRLASLLSPEQREILAATMLEDVLSALAGATRLAGILVNTVDPRAAALAERYGARVVTEGARDGHTGAVNGMARVLAAEGDGALLTLPGDIPRVTAREIDAVVVVLPRRAVVHHRSGA